MRGTETVIIKRHTAGAVDAHGNPTRTTASITVTGVLVGIGGGSEPIEPCLLYTSDAADE